VLKKFSAFYFSTTKLLFLSRVKFWSRCFRKADDADEGEEISLRGDLGLLPFAAAGERLKISCAARGQRRFSRQSVCVEKDEAILICARGCK
jgi:hypothetical protein